MNEYSEIAKSIDTIHLKTKLLEIETIDGELVVDVQLLLQAPVGSEEAYFKATDIAKKFGKDARKFLDNANTKDYIEALNDFFLNSQNFGGLKNGLFYTKRGKYQGGTWFHKELFLKFASWLSPKFEVQMHQVVKQLIIYSDQLKIDRLDTKFLYKELGKTVKELYLPHQSQSSKRFTYVNLANLINLKVLGYTAKQYRELHNVDPNIAIRDTLPDETLDEIIEVEKDMNGYIKYGKIYDYNTLKKQILGR